MGKLLFIVEKIENELRFDFAGELFRPAELVDDLGLCPSQRPQTLERVLFSKVVDKFDGGDERLVSTSGGDRVGQMNDRIRHKTTQLAQLAVRSRLVRRSGNDLLWRLRCPSRS